MVVVILKYTNDDLIIRIIDSLSLLPLKIYVCDFNLPAARDESHPQEPDETLLDECCLLPSQLLVPSMDWLPINDGVITKIQSKHHLRLQFGKPYTLPGLNPNSQIELFLRWATMRVLFQIFLEFKFRHTNKLNTCAYKQEILGLLDTACTHCILFAMMFLFKPHHLHVLCSINTRNSLDYFLRMQVSF